MYIRVEVYKCLCLFMWVRTCVSIFTILSRFSYFISQFLVYFKSRPPTADNLVTNIVVKIFSTYIILKSFSHICL